VLAVLAAELALGVQELVPGVQVLVAGVQESVPWGWAILVSEEPV
jgi:hypothetical protein